jgi:hypothetical protein
MKKPYKKVFEFKDDFVTTIVLDFEEFCEVCDSCESMINLDSGDRATAEVVEQLKQSKVIPLMCLGSRTSVIFEKYEIDTKYASFIVRGHGRELFKELVESVAAEIAAEAEPSFLPRPSVN